jgi:hypothetical protein
MGWFQCRVDCTLYSTQRRILKALGVDEDPQEAEKKDGEADLPLRASHDTLGFVSSLGIR